MKINSNSNYLPCETNYFPCDKMTDKSFSLWRTRIIAEMMDTRKLSEYELDDVYKFYRKDAQKMIR